MPFVVAIDGLAASGKGTIARGLARHLRFKHLDTGLIYRAVAANAVQRGGGKCFDHDAIEIAKNFSAELLLLRNLRSSEAGKLASKIAKNGEIRQHLMSFQREFSKTEPGVVMDGRDIGTVICPNAEVKIFVTAAISVRAERRFQELKETEQSISKKKIQQDLLARDRLDINRKISPLKLSEDAHLIDTTELSIEASVAKAICLVNEKKRIMD